MKLSPYIAPAIGTVVSTSAVIVFEGIAKQLSPSDLKAVPSFGIKLGVAVVGGILAGKLADYVASNITSVVETVTHTGESEDVDPPKEDD